MTSNYTTIRFKKLTQGKESSDTEEAKGYHLRKLYELSVKSISKKPQLEEPTEEQKRWAIHKMKNPTSWEVWDQE